MTTAPTIRSAVLGDLNEITNIYNHYIKHSASTFDTSPWLTEDRIEWFEQFKAETIHQCLVLSVESTNVGDEIMGYACSSTFRKKPAYDTSVETTIYLHPNARGHGLGQLLYKQLLENLDLLNIHRVYGIITLPNAGSVKLHEALGYVSIGTLTEVGYKFDQYWDTLWLERKGGLT